MKTIVVIFGLSAIACIAMLTNHDGIVVQTIITGIMTIVGYGLAKEVNKERKAEA